MTPSLAALPKILLAFSSPVFVGVQPVCGQLVPETFPKPQWPMFALLKPGTPPFWPFLLVSRASKYPILLCGMRPRSMIGLFQLRAEAPKSDRSRTKVPTPFWIVMSAALSMTSVPFGP